MAGGAYDKERENSVPQSLPCFFLRAGRLAYEPTGVLFACPDPDSAFVW